MASYTHFEIAVPSGLHWYNVEIDGENPVSSSSTLLVLPNSDGTQTRIIGTGFTYDPMTGEPTGGTVTSITRTNSSGATIYEQVTGLSLSLVALVNAGEGNGPAFALIFAGVDTFNGWSGADLFVGGDLGDSFLGGIGTDFVSYDNSPVGLTADLGTPANNTGFAAGDNYNNSIEGLIGSSFADNLRGNGQVNSLIGGAGNDFLRGRGGADALDGGAGGDWADYFGATLAVTVDLSNSNNNTNDAFGDTFISIEHIRGSDNNDTLTGDGNNNFLRGGLGQDALNGGGGGDTADYQGAAAGLTVDLGNTSNNTGEAVGDSYNSIENLRGSTGSDTLRGDSGNNLLDGQAGAADTLDGGDGFDFAWYNTNSTGTGVTASLANPGINTGDAAGDTYISIEGLIGSGSADTLIGDSSNNFLRGQDGADTLNGGGGFDHVDYFLATSGITVDLLTPSNNTGEAVGDTFTAIEGIRGSAFNDTLRGDDVINGGSAVNFLRGGLGADTLDGRGGHDFADYDGSTIGLTVSLANPASNTGEAAGDVFISIESLLGTTFNDTLIGDTSTNRLGGGLGADTLDGGIGLDYAWYLRSSAGLTVNLANSGLNTGEAVGDIFISIEGIRGSDFSDTLIGDSQNNFLAGGAGADSLDGGDGIDTADYQLWTAQVGVVASLLNPGSNTGDAAGDTYTSIENLWGTSSGDTLIGDGNANVLTGDAGNDTLDGNGGVDTLDGGTGLDTASYASAGSGITARLDLGFGQDDGGAFDTYTSIENAVGSNFGDTLVGLGGVANTLNGGDGDDFLYGEGIDTVIGGSGSDVFFGGQGGALNLDLATASIETVWGSVVGDTINGSTSSANLSLIGQGGADTMSGGSGDDFLYFDNLDIISGGTGNDWAVATLSASGVTLNMAATGFENAWGSTSGDTITAAGSGTTAVIVGDTGNDILTGGNAGDFLYGFGDNDTLTGGGGNDNLIGGAGSDTFAFGAGWGTDIVWDWQDGVEQFDMQGSGAASFAALTVDQNYFGSGNALISFSGNQILVVGAANQIDAGDFVF